jgi:thioredoxin-related protein
MMKFKIILITSILLISGIVSGQDKPESADKIMTDAFKLAKSEGKSVMIVFHASWCGWCKKFEASVNDPSCRNFFEDNFVIRYLDILERGDKKSIENPGAIDIFNKNGGEGGGIPYFLIYDKNKNLISDSKMKMPGDGPEKPMQNIGCPASEEEAAAFIKILSKAEKISDAEKIAITERFRKNGN